MSKLTDAELDKLIMEEQQAGNTQGAMSDEELDSMIAKEMADDQSALPEAEAALEGFGKEASFGYLPNLQAGAYQAIEEGADTLGLLPEGYEKETYDETLEDMKGRQQALQEQSPYAFGAGQVGGIVAPAMAGMGAAKAVSGGLRAKRMKGAYDATKGLGMADKAKALQASRAGLGYTAEKLGAGALGAGTIGQRIAGGATLAGAEGAIYNPEGAPGFTEDPMANLTARGQNALLSGAVGGPGAEALIGGVRGIARGMKLAKDSSSWVGMKVMTSLLGAEEEMMMKYLKNPTLISEAKTQEEITEAVQEIVRKTRVEADEATISLKEANQRVRETEKILKEEFKEKGKELTKAFNYVKTELSRAVDSSIDQMNRVAPPTHLTDPVVESIDTLKSMVGQGSKEATNALLREVDGPIGIYGAAEVLEDSLDDLTIKGRVPTFMDGQAQQIRAIRDDLLEYGDEMSPYEVKKYIKQLDTAIAISEEAGTYSDAATKAKIALRSYMDSIIKQASPTYAAMMEAVADDARLLSQARRYFGKPERARAKLSAIMQPNNQDVRKTLERLADRTGKDFRESLLEHQQTKNQLAGHKIDAIRSGKLDSNLAKDQELYPRYEEAKLELETYKAIKDSERDRMIAAELAQTRARREATAAVERSEAAQEAMEAISYMKESSVPNKINSLVQFFNNGAKGSRITARQELEKLSALSDKDFVRQIEAMALASGFDKSFLRGSRNVNLWGALGMMGGDITTARTGSGAAIGGTIMGPAGVAVGAATGAMIDIYGPRMARKILDQVISIKGIPTVQKIQRLRLPAEVKAELEQGLRGFIYMSTAGEPADINAPIPIEPEDLGAVKEDLLRNGDLSNTQKARMISSLNRSGELTGAKDLYGSFDPLEDIKKKGLFKGQWKDTGRDRPDLDYGGMLDSLVGAPFRQIASGLAEGSPRQGIARAKAQLGKDPMTAPNWDQILEKGGVEAGGGRDALSMAAMVLEPGLPGAFMAKAGALPMAGTVRAIQGGVDNLVGDRILKLIPDTDTQKKALSALQDADTIEEVGEALSKIGVKGEAAEEISTAWNRLNKSELAELGAKESQDLKRNRILESIEKELSGADTSNVSRFPVEKIQYGGRYSKPASVIEGTEESLRGLKSRNLEAASEELAEKTRREELLESMTNQKKLISAEDRFKEFGKRPTVAGEDAEEISMYAARNKRIADDLGSFGKMRNESIMEGLSETEQGLADVIRFPKSMKRGRKVTKGEDAEMYDLDTGRRSDLSDVNPIRESGGPLGKDVGRDTALSELRMEDKPYGVYNGKLLVNDEPISARYGLGSIYEEGLPLYDLKHKKILNHMKSRKEPIKITTQGDTIAMSDYVKAIPKGSEINFLTTGGDAVSDPFHKAIKSQVKGIAASDKRIQKAARKIIEERPDVKVNVTQMNERQIEGLTEELFNSDISRATNQLERIARADDTVDMERIAEYMEQDSVLLRDIDFDLMNMGIKDKRVRKSLSNYIESGAESMGKKKLLDSGNFEPKDVFNMDAKKVADETSRLRTGVAEELTDDSYGAFSDTIRGMEDLSPKKAEALESKVLNEAESYEDAVRFAEEAGLDSYDARQVGEAFDDYKNAFEEGQALDFDDMDF